MRTHSKKHRTNPQFYPIPTTHKRGILRWVLLMFHVTPFAVAVFVYPSVISQLNTMLNHNTVQIMILIWCGLLLVHFVLVVLIELRENVQYGWRERRRRNAYRRERKSQQFVVWHSPGIGDHNQNGT